MSHTAAEPAATNMEETDETVELTTDKEINLGNGGQRKRSGLRKYAKLDPAMAKDILLKAESGELASMAYQYGDRIQPKPGHLYLVTAPAADNPFRTMRYKDSFDWQHSSKHTWPESAGLAQIKYIFYKLRQYYCVDPSASGFKQRRIYWLIDAEDSGYDSYFLVEYAPVFTPHESTNFTLASPETDPPMSEAENEKFRGQSGSGALKKSGGGKRTLSGSERNATSDGDIAVDAAAAAENADEELPKTANKRLAYGSVSVAAAAAAAAKKRRSRRVVKVSDRFQAAIGDLDKAQKMTKLLRNKLESLYHLSLLRKELVE